MSVGLPLIKMYSRLQLKDAAIQKKLFGSETILITLFKILLYQYEMLAKQLKMKKKNKKVDFLACY